MKYLKTQTGFKRKPNVTLEFPRRGWNETTFCEEGIDTFLIYMEIYNPEKETTIVTISVAKFFTENF